MAQLQVLLKGENWRLRLLIYLLLFVIALVILEVWYPGSLASVFLTIKKSLSLVYDFVGNILGNLGELARKISAWFR